MKLHNTTASAQQQFHKEQQQRVSKEMFILIEESVTIVESLPK
jgi:hypothetical protein